MIITDRGVKSKSIVPSAGLEPATYGLEDRCSVLLSYEGIKLNILKNTNVPVIAATREKAVLISSILWL